MTPDTTDRWEVGWDGKGQDGPGSIVLPTGLDIDARLVQSMQ